VKNNFISIIALFLILSGCVSNNKRIINSAEMNSPAQLSVIKNIDMKVVQTVEDVKVWAADLPNNCKVMATTSRLSAVFRYSYDLPNNTISGFTLIIPRYDEFGNFQDTRATFYNGASEVPRARKISVECFSQKENLTESEFAQSISEYFKIRFAQ
jgi:hypothetical protein